MINIESDIKKFDISKMPKNAFVDCLAAILLEIITYCRFYG